MSTDKKVWWRCEDEKVLEIQQQQKSKKNQKKPPKKQKKQKRKKEITIRNL